MSNAIEQTGETEDSSIKEINSAMISHGSQIAEEIGANAVLVYVDMINSRKNLEYLIKESRCILAARRRDVTPFAEKWSWESHVNYGFGGSEGTFGAQTGISWRFLTHWSATLYGKYTAVDFENGSKEDNDWYLYDVDEYGLGLSILFNW